MTREEMFGLVAGEMVVVKGSGKVYRCKYVTPAYTPEKNEQIQADMAKQRAEKGYYIGPVPGWGGEVCFVMQRNGKDFGPVRHLNPENIEKVGAS